MHPKCLEPCLAPTKYAEKIFLRFYLLIFRERGREGEREGKGGRKRGEGREKERERNIISREKCRLLASRLRPQQTGDQTCNLGMCPDQEFEESHPTN